MLCDWDIQTLDYWNEQLELEKQEGREGEMGIKVGFSPFFKARPMPRTDYA